MSNSDIIKAVARTSDDEIKNLLIELMGHRQLIQKLKGHLDLIHLEVLKIDTQLKSEILINTKELLTT